jgi:hypothetical protein
MAEANLNKAHQVMTYLMLIFIPTILSWLLTKLAEVSHDLTCHWEWNHICLTVRHHSRKHCKKKKARQPSKNKDQVQRKRSFTPTYLLPLALIVFKVGCQVEHSIHRLKVALTTKQLPKLVAFAAAAQMPYKVPRICFDTNSFVIGVTIFASVTLRNHPNQFDDLKLHSG